MKILVIGASGYLGQEILGQCEEAGHTVTGTYAHHEKPGLKKFEFGVSNPDDLLNLEDFDAVIWSAYGYRPGLGDFLLRTIADNSSIRLIYVSSDAVTAKAALEHDGPLGEYARMKQSEEKIAGGHSLVLRVGPMYGKTASGKEDNRTQQLIERCQRNEQQTYWDNVYKSFTPVMAIAKRVVAELASSRTGTYFLGPDVRESYFQFFCRQAKELGLSTSLLSPTQLDETEAQQKGIELDTSFGTHPQTIKISE